MQLEEVDVRSALEELRADVLVWRSDGQRSVRWSESITRRLSLDGARKPILTVLFLRGAQTPGELRARTSRMWTFDSLGEVEESLRSLSTGDAPLVAELPRQPGQKESRWIHLLVGGADDDQPVSATSGSKLRLEERVTRLEDQVSALERHLARLEPPSQSTDT